MKSQPQYTRVALAAVGLLTMTLSLRVIFVAGSQLSGWHGDPLSDASVVVLLLGILLGFGGGCLTVRGIKYQSRAKAD